MQLGLPEREGSGLSKISSEYSDQNSTLRQLHFDRVRRQEIQTVPRELEFGPVLFCTILFSNFNLLK